VAGGVEQPQLVFIAVPFAGSAVVAVSDEPAVAVYL
jgi:hypothetical protein